MHSPVILLLLLISLYCFKGSNDVTILPQSELGDVPTTTPLFLNDILCEGTELELIDCISSRETSDCVLIPKVAGVRCQDSGEYW